MLEKLLYKDIKCKSWKINGTKNIVTKSQKDIPDIESKEFKLTISYEKVFTSPILTLEIDGYEYSTLLYEDILNYIKN